MAKAIRFCETGGRRSCAGRESRSTIPAAARSACVLTRPAPADYIAERAALAGELFPRVAAGKITIEINQRYALEDTVADPSGPRVRPQHRLVGPQPLTTNSTRLTRCLPMHAVKLRR